MEFPAEAPVNPEVEDTVEEAIGGWQPHHHELDPLWDAATRDGCGTEHMVTEVRRISRVHQHNTAASDGREVADLMLILKKVLL